jgi:2-polyprenyl-6-methoxyphenol hydroxylase-like FAD-dependent oxidoreductase
MGHQRCAIIIGAGPAGLAAAVALRAAGFGTRVYERRTDLRTVGTGLTLWPNGLAALASFRADTPVRGKALAAPGTVMRAQSGRVLYELSGPAMDAIGGRGIAIHRADLLEALAGMLADDTLRLGARCTAVRSEPDRAVARFEDGTEAAADLLVGADGIRSGVRAAGGIPARLDYGGFVVWRATIPFQLPPYPGLLTLGGPYQFGIWGLPGERVYWFASAPAPEGAQRRGDSRPPELFREWHEPIDALLTATPTDLITSTDIYDCPPLPAWSSGRVVLVGDAAHPSMPNMGQGTSQAFEDVAVLASSLAGRADIGDALREYEARRRRRAQAAWSQARMLARLGGWHSRPAVLLRERMMTMVPERAQLGQLRRLFTFTV